MSTYVPFPSRNGNPSPRPFPTRGVAGGWSDPWDDDPLAAVRPALPHYDPCRRQMTEAGVLVELLARARADGRWEAHVASNDGLPAYWPSVNGPTAAVALDALEGEVRELLRDTSAVD